MRKKNGATRQNWSLSSSMVPPQDRGRVDPRGTGPAGRRMGRMARIGYTPGVFDMFHIGHLNLIRRARERCDYLIVGVATDELSIRQKGKRPLVPFLERVEIVQSIRYVDQVVPYDTPDRLDAWARLKFDIFFKGDDWKDLPSSKELEKKFSEIGVEAVYLPYTQHRSSTLLRTRVAIQQGE